MHSNVHVHCYYFTFYRFCSFVVGFIKYSFIKVRGHLCSHIPGGSKWNTVTLPRSAKVWITLKYENTIWTQKKSSAECNFTLGMYEALHVKGEEQRETEIKIERRKVQINRKFEFDWIQSKIIQHNRVQLHFLK